MGQGLLLWTCQLEKMKKMLMDIQMMGTTAFYPDKKITSRVIDFTVVKADAKIAEKLKLRKQASFIKFIVSA